MKVFLRHWLKQLQTTVAGGAVILGIASLLSRVLGLLRDRLLSSHFGVSPVLDSYFHAFKVPDFLFNILVLGVLSASFVPVIIEASQKKGEEEVSRIASSVLTILIILLSAFAVIAFIFTPQLVQLIASSDSSADKAMTVTFMRPMLIAVVFFAISNVLAGLLHAKKQFVIYALAPLLYNIGIIFGIVVLVPVFGNAGLGYGVLLGAVMHALIQIPAAVANGFRYRPHISLRNPFVLAIFKQAPSRALALGMTQLNILILFSIAASVGDDARSIFQFADNLQHFPINIFGVSLALAAFPVFSEAFASNNVNKFKKAFSENFRRIIFFLIPISIATILLRAQIVRVVYGAGAFDWPATIAVAQLLGIFAVSLTAQALIPLLARSYFAKQDTTTPVVITIVCVVVNAGLAWGLAPVWGVYGIGVAYSASAVLQMMLLLWGLRLRYGNLDDAHILMSTAKILFASLGMGLVIQGLKYTVEPLVNMDTFIGVATQGVVALIAGGYMYIEIARRFHFDEAVHIHGKLRDVHATVKKVVRGKK